MHSNTKYFNQKSNIIEDNSSYDNDDDDDDDENYYFTDTKLRPIVTIIDELGIYIHLNNNNN